ncbi:glycosyltransferase family 2 protein [Vibrio sp. 1CM2L]|uniref:glycosyltransferase family 2 protein n=1 Tax=Vibrio sp. 1CM2L TaxID=2929166 RepID=UPI0020BD95A8|nr:glycosyltransferase family 2 protein [Vibrio sp. 1CM2L]MCK8078659.1 glycosyltransferase family 2 protein [Vibrio sp. 1CM2L]
MTTHVSIGVLMIVKNAEQHLEKTLSSVSRWVDEIVILDSGSTDGTLDIARKYTDSVYHQDWLGFGPQRQKAQSLMNSDWVLPLDSDEEVSPELKASILHAVKTDDGKSVYKINRLTEAFGKFIRHSGWYPDRVTRLYPRLATQYNDVLVHESVIVPEGFKVKQLDGDLFHYTIDSMPNYVRKTQHYMEAWADQREGKKSVSLTNAISHGFFRFFKMYIIKRGFLDGRHGLLLALLSANTTFTRYADLWLRDYMKKKKRVE